MLTGADPSCGSFAEWPVRRAGKHKTLYVIAYGVALQYRTASRSTRGILRVSASQCPTNCRRWAIPEQPPRAGSPRHQGPMSTDAWLQEHCISRTILPRARRTPRLSPLPVPHVPTCSGSDAAPSPHASHGNNARNPGGRLNGRTAYPSSDAMARKLTEPFGMGRNDLTRAAAGQAFRPADR
jgi:hypothetical protein